MLLHYHTIDGTVSEKATPLSNISRARLLAAKPAPGAAGGAGAAWEHPWVLLTPRGRVP